MNRKLMVAALVVCAAFGVSNNVRAQSLPSITVPPSSTNTPYLLDSQRMIVRNSTGECWRTGYWTAELAQSTPVAGSDFPAGCICDKPLMPQAVCEPKPMAAVTPPPEPVAPPPPPMATSQKVTIPADALFQFDKSALSASGKDKLTVFADKVKTLNLEAVVAVGHTDRIGSEAYNQKLSERRAQSVKDFLVGQGVPADRVYIEGRGESQPVTGTDCQGKDSGKNKKLVECLAPDRRVIIEAVGSPR
ncbi:MAG: OmpA family protein [Aquabacterium sp.]|uniref:OmpA family protein n=1 Tax=Aquabacterium sp. TaxID=1872578 RepID=UPI002718BB1A|nr:OmpA family protein [Aquabacterium sp.]MDO9002109.1 OmpA family protein [Aquabacterium sp.]